jgi:hypothetical protein
MIYNITTGSHLTGLVWAQKNQRGVVALSTVIDHSGRLAAPDATGMNPESTPFVGVVSRTQGLAKVDWVTDCGINTKIISIELSNRV